MNALFSEYSSQLTTTVIASWFLNVFLKHMTDIWFSHLAQPKCRLFLYALQYKNAYRACILCRHLTCPVDNINCSLCQHNPNRRCELDKNFAAKQLEKQPLVSACGSPVRVSLKQYDISGQGSVDCCSSSSQAAVQECDALCLEVCIMAFMQPFTSYQITLSVMSTCISVTYTDVCK